MLVFVDESGDAGLKFGSGSSDHFVVALIIFEDDDEANLTDDRIQLLKEEVFSSQNAEFHFNKCRPSVRKRFLEAVMPYNFFYFGVIINKRKLTGEGFQYKESFYKYLSGLVFENAKPYLDRATVILDGSGSKDFRSQLQRYLKKRINSPNSSEKIKKVKIQDSKRNNLIQLADMVCGAIARSYKKGKKDSEDYRRIIRPREINVQRWPK
ncbi:MAG: DUF3800 domain-containing protein [Nitrospirae bacterium]|nr:DUF3800 domain-containing protein [Candidatus Manganitrophaceae bacterium]